MSYLHKKSLSANITVGFIALFAHSCFLDGLLPKGKGALTQAASGTLAKIDSLFGGNETISAQQGALALGITMTMAMDQRLAENQVPADSRKIMTMKASEELKLQVGSLSASLNLVTDANTLKTLIAKTAAGAVAAGAMKGVGAISETQTASTGLALSSDEASSLSSYGGWALGATINALGGDATSDLSADAKGEIAASTLKQAIASIAVDTIGAENFSLFSQSITKNAIADAEKGLAVGVSTEDFKTIAGQIVSGAVAGIQTGKLSSEYLANTVRSTTEGAAQGFKSVSGNSEFKLAVVGTITASAMTSLKSGLNLSSTLIVALSKEVIAGPMNQITSMASSLGEVGPIMKALTGEAVKAAAALVDASSVGTLAGNIASSAISSMSVVASGFKASQTEIASAKLVQSTMSGTIAGFSGSGVDQTQLTANLGEITKAATQALGKGNFSSVKNSVIGEVIEGTAKSLSTAGVVSSSMVASAMMAVSQGASEGMTSFVSQASDVTSMLSTIMTSSVGILNTIGVTSGTQLTAITEKIVKGASMGLGSLVTSGVVSSSALSGNISAISDAALNSLQGFNTSGYIDSSSMTGFASNMASGIFSGLAVGGKGNVGDLSSLQSGFVTNLQSSYVNLGYNSGDVDTSAITTKVNLAVTLASQISSGSISICENEFGDNLSDALLQSAAAVKLSALAAGDEKSFLCQKSNAANNCPRVRNNVGGIDIGWANQGSFCEYHEYTPLVNTAIKSCSVISVPAGKAELSPYYDAALGQVRCEMSGGNCPTLAAEVMTGGLNWVKFTPPAAAGQTTAPATLCLFTPPVHDINPGNTTFKACPTTFDLSKPENLYNSPSHATAPGYATYQGVACLRTVGAACPTFTTTPPASVSFFQWDSSVATYQMSSGPRAAGDLCLLVGDYESALMTLTGTFDPPNPSVMNATLTSITPVSVNASFTGATSYQCYFDRKIDGFVHSSPFSNDSAPCQMLKEGSGFSFSAGSLQWTPPNSPGTWEFKIVATDGTNRGAKMLTVVNRPDFSKSSLRLSFDAMFSNFDYNGPNSNQGPNATKFYGRDESDNPTFVNISNFTTSAGWRGDISPYRTGGSPETFQFMFNGGASPVTLDFGQVLKNGAAAQSGLSNMMIDGWFRFLNGFQSDGSAGDFGIMGNVTTAAGNDTGIQVFEKQRAGPTDYQRRVEVVIGGQDTYEKRVLASTPAVYYRFDRIIAQNKIPNLVTTPVGGSQEPFWATINPTQYKLSTSVIGPPASPALPASNDGYLWRGDGSSGIDIVPVAGGFGSLTPSMCPMSWEAMIYVQTGTFGSATPLIKAYHSSTNKDGWQILFDPNSGGQLRLDIGIGTGTPISFMTNFSSPSFSRDLWNHVVINCVHQSSPNQIYAEFFVNGVSAPVVSATPVGYSGISYSGVTQIVINSGNDSINSTPQLLVDEVAIYGNKTLSATVVADHYAATKVASLISPPISDDWHHLGIGYTDYSGGSGDILELHIDGKWHYSATLTTTAPASPRLNSSSNTSNFLVGRVPGGKGWGGSLGDLRFYNVVDSSVFIGSQANFLTTGPRYFITPSSILSLSGYKQPTLWLTTSRTTGAELAPISNWTSVGNYNSLNQSDINKKPHRRENLFDKGLDSDGFGIQFNGSSIFGSLNVGAANYHKTIILAARFTSNAATTDTIFKFTNNSTSKFEMRRTGNNGDLTFAYTHPTGTPDFTCTVPGVLPKRDKPYIISMVSGSGPMNLFVDGTATSTECYQSFPTTWINFSNLYLGAADANGTNSVNMDLSDFIFYEEDLNTATEIPAIEKYLKDKLNIIPAS